MTSTDKRLPEADIRAILRAADEIIGMGGRTLLVKILQGSRAQIQSESHQVRREPLRIERELLQIDQERFKIERETYRIDRGSL